MAALTRAGGPPTARLLGAGGEAEVYEVPNRPGLAYKRYRRPTPARTAKLRVMLAHPPVVDGGKATIAWPVELVTQADGEAAGFLMPRIDLRTSLPVFRLYNPMSRRQVAPGFTWRYLLRTARNVAAVVDALHRAGYVIGDLNESNLLVSNRALVSLVDCDSMQVSDPVTGDVHRCRVGKPEYTAPELQAVDLDAEDRTEASDAFALAVVIFQLLLEGVHPFGGIWKGRVEPPDIAARMRSAPFPYGVTATTLVPPPLGLGLDVLPPPVRRLAWRTFTSGMRRPSRRPTPLEWLEALDDAESRLTVCARSPHHEHPVHLRRCPWCERIDAGLPDPFPGPTGRSDLRPRPPPRRVLLWRAIRRRASTGASSAGQLGRQCIRGAAAVRRRGARVPDLRTPTLRRRVPLALSLARVELPLLVLVAATGALLPLRVLAILGAALPAVGHAAMRAGSQRRSRFGTITLFVRLLPATSRAAARCAAVAASSAGAVVVLLAAAVSARSTGGLSLDALSEQVGDLTPLGAALAAVLVVRWPPQSGESGWRQDVNKAMRRLRPRIRGRSVVALWVVAAGGAIRAVATAF